MSGKRAGTLLELIQPIEHFTLDRAWQDLTDDEFFWEPFTTAWSVRRRFIAGALNEVGHHGAQIGALRDFYAWQAADRR